MSASIKSFAMEHLIPFSVSNRSEVFILKFQQWNKWTFRNHTLHSPVWFNERLRRRSSSKWRPRVALKSAWRTWLLLVDTSSRIYLARCNKNSWGEIICRVSGTPIISCVSIRKNLVNLDHHGGHAIGQSRSAFFIFWSHCKYCSSWWVQYYPSHFLKRLITHPIFLNTLHF